MDELRDFIKAEFVNVNRRLDEHRELSTERHRETQTRLSSMELDVRARHAENSARLSALDDDVQESGRKLAAHDQQLRTLFQRAKGEFSRLRLYVGLFGGGAVALVWLLKLLKVL